MGGNRRGAPGSDEDYSFVSPVVKYLLFIFNFIFWIISLVMVSIGVYARMMKHAEAALSCLSADPAVMLLVVGVLMFIITFCGCVGSLRENICLLQTFCICLTVIFLLQLVAGVLGFIFADKARNKVTEVINKAIINYREDLDLQNLIDFGQREVFNAQIDPDPILIIQGIFKDVKKVKQFGCCGGVTYTDWSQNMYFNCSDKNPSRERCSVPFSCCIISQDKAVINTMCGQSVQLLEYIEAGTIIHANGCIDKLVNWIHSNMFLLGGIALGLAIPQLVGILLSQILINQIKDQIELQNYNQKHRYDPWS